jgi:protein-disulfide isomerase
MADVAAAESVLPGPLDREPVSVGSRRAREQARQQALAAARQRRQRRIALFTSLAVLVLLVGGGIAFQAWRTQRAPTAPATADPSRTPITISEGMPILLGSTDAPVRLSIYEDFHCPHCAEFEEQYGEVLTAAQNNGKAAVELYPMSFIDSGSTAAANAMACAAEAGFGWSYYRGLFANATLEWNDEQLINLAEQITSSPGSDFTPCVTERKHAAWVDSINAAAAANGVNSTPTVFLDGTPLDLASLTPQVLQTKIDEAATT